MKYKKMIGVGLVVAGLTSSLIFGVSASKASGEYMGISSKGFKDAVENIYYREMSDDELLDLQEKSTVKKEVFQRYDPFMFTLAMGEEIGDISGIDNVKTEHLVITGKVQSFKHIAKMTGLKSIELQTTTEKGIGSNLTGDISWLSNLKELERIKWYHHDYSERALIDLSPLNDLPALKRVQIGTSGTVDPIKLKAGYRKYEVYNPITLSNHFNGYTCYSIQDDIGSESNGLLKWNAIPFGTEYLYYSFFAEGRDDYGDFHYYNAYVKIPIIWEQ